MAIVCTSLLYVFICYLICFVLRVCWGCLFVCFLGEGVVKINLTYVSLPLELKAQLVVSDLEFEEGTCSSETEMNYFW